MFMWNHSYIKIDKSIPGYFCLLTLNKKKVRYDIFKSLILLKELSKRITYKDYRFLIYKYIF